MAEKIVVIWFQQNLRLEDNPALFKAAQCGKVLPIYIFSNYSNQEISPIGSASKWWLYYSLNQLNNSLAGNLNFYMGNPAAVVLQIINNYDVQAVYWNRCYDPLSIKHEDKLVKVLESAGIDHKSYNGSLLWEPWEILKKENTPYKVFTPFYHRCIAHIPFIRPLYPVPHQLKLIDDKHNYTTLEDFQLLPSHVTWYEKLHKYWEVGELSAKKKLNRFIKSNLIRYHTNRDYLGSEYTSRLSPYLHFGEISPNQIIKCIYQYIENASLPKEGVNHFIRELVWREFSYYLLYHFPKLLYKNLQPSFDQFPWKYNKVFLKAWQQGKTGIPIVDAGMRELWETGYMHNRVRMVVASFLVKNLLLHWHHGRDWFWDCLVDADIANNSAGWQWVTGCGVDAAPYFRIFNPVIQGEKFDPHGEYVKKFIPELKKLPIQYLFKPWEAPQHILRSAAIELGTTYPQPIVDLKYSRHLALQSYKTIS